MAELKYLTLKEASQILSVSTRTLANLAIGGQISAYRLPSVNNKKPRYRFKSTDLEEFMNNHKLNSIDSTVKNVFKGNKARIDIENIKKVLSGRN